MTRIHLSVPHMGGDEEAWSERLLPRTASPPSVRTSTRSNANFRVVSASRSPLGSGRPPCIWGSGSWASGLATRCCAPRSPSSRASTRFATWAPLQCLSTANPRVDDGPARVAEAIESKARQGRLPKAVVVVTSMPMHRHGPILEACGNHGVPVLEDAAKH